MQFLRTLFWVALAVAVVLFASANWNSVTLTLWGGLQADVKLPALIFFAFLLGLVPMFLISRARIWTLKRRLEALERQIAASLPAAPPPVPGAVEPLEPVDPAAPRPASDDRVATDSKVWPAS